MWGVEILSQGFGILRKDTNKEQCIKWTKGKCIWENSKSNDCSQ